MPDFTITMTDYTEKEIEAVEEALRQRYRKDVDVYLADCEVQPDTSRNEVSEHPALFWQVQGCNFVVIKSDNDKFEGRFFYNPDEHFGGKRQKFTDVVNCVLNLLRDQADEVRASQGVPTGTTGADLN